MGNARLHVPDAPADFSHDKFNLAFPVPAEPFRAVAVVAAALAAFGAPFLFPARGHTAGQGSGRPDQIAAPRECTPGIRPRHRDIALAALKKRLGCSARRDSSAAVAPLSANIARPTAAAPAAHRAYRGCNGLPRSPAPVPARVSTPF